VGKIEPSMANMDLRRWMVLFRLPFPFAVGRRWERGSWSAVPPLSGDEVGDVLPLLLLLLLLLPLLLLLVLSLLLVSQLLLGGLLPAVSEATMVADSDNSVTGESRAASWTATMVRASFLGGPGPGCEWKCRKERREPKDLLDAIVDRAHKLDAGKRKSLAGWLCKRRITPRAPYVSTRR
jgi:hypothetical protein